MEEEINDSASEEKNLGRVLTQMLTYSLYSQSDSYQLFLFEEQDDKVLISSFLNRFFPIRFDVHLLASCHCLWRKCKLWEREGSLLHRTGVKS